MADSDINPNEERLRRYFFDDIPLPPNYRMVTTPEGDIQYLDEITQEITAIHPAQTLFEKRASTSSMGQDTSKFSLQTKHLLDSNEWTANTSQGWLEGSTTILLPTIVGMPRQSSLHETPIPEVLTFYSWWSEETLANGLQRKHIKISYQLHSKEFTLHFKDTKDCVRLSHIMGKYGPINEFDLHIGFTMNVLGKNVTLKQADIETREWIDREFQRLRKVRDMLVKELGKYDLDYRRVDDIYAAEPKGSGGTRCQAAAFPVRRVKLEVKELYDHLKKLRPQRAQRLEQKWGS